jgi:hypothetical protein
MLDYGCKRGPGVTDPGLFFCTAHLSYGYEREGRCHHVGNRPPYQSSRAYDGPIASPFTRRALAGLLPPKEYAR